MKFPYFYQLLFGSKKFYQICLLIFRKSDLEKLNKDELEYYF